jgi:hypothetical protein
MEKHFWIFVEKENQTQWKFSGEVHKSWLKFYFSQSLLAPHHDNEAEHQQHEGHDHSTHQHGEGMYMRGAYVILYTFETFGVIGIHDEIGKSFYRDNVERIESFVRFLGVW